MGDRRRRSTTAGKNLETAPRQISSPRRYGAGNVFARDSRDRGAAGDDDGLGKRKKADTAGEYEDGGIYGITCFLGKRKSGKSSRMGSLLAPVKRLLLFDGRGASPHSQNFFEKFNF